EMAKEADILMTCLPMPADVEQVFLDEDDGLIPNSKEGQLLIDFSTISPDLATRLYERARDKGAAFLDAPISGGTVGAEQGTLSIMVGGDEDAYEKGKPLFDVLGSNVYYTGPSGNGTIVKLLNQYMVGVHTQAVGEALTLADQLEIDKDMLF